MVMWNLYEKAEKNKTNILCFGNIENILCTYEAEFFALVLTVRLTFFDRNQTTIGNHLFTSLFIFNKVHFKLWNEEALS